MPVPEGVSRGSALARLVQLRNDYVSAADTLASRNEAKTRLLIIDELLFALGWPKDGFNPEQPDGAAGHTDYLLTVDGYGPVRPAVWEGSRAVEL